MTDETNTTAPAAPATEGIADAGTPPAALDASNGTPPAAPEPDTAIANPDSDFYRGDSGDEGPGTPAPKTHFDYHESPGGHEGRR